MNRLGILIDMAHTSHAAQTQILALSKAPVAFTHGNALTLCDHPRNVADDILDGIKANGGVVMATFVPAFICQAGWDWLKPLHDSYGKGPPTGTRREKIGARERVAGPYPLATLDELADHLDYMRARIGEDHLGIGSDFFGGVNPKGLEDVSTFPDLFAELMARDWSDTALEKLASGNITRVLRAVEQAAEV
jgi:membrane dipeptidase